MNYVKIERDNAFPIKAWVNGVPFSDAARAQLSQIAELPIIHSHIAVMPDVHLGKGATVGSVVPTYKAIIPSAVGVDIGCGMMAVLTSLTASDPPDNLHAIRSSIEAANPHGRSNNGRSGDVGAWSDVPERVDVGWASLAKRFEVLVEKHPRLAKSNNRVHLGTLGGGNHFIEICLDETDRVWIMLHSGSRGVGNAIGSYFINKAKEEVVRLGLEVPNKDLSYLREDSPYFEDYIHALEWAQDYARMNREIMMHHTTQALRQHVPNFQAQLMAVNCHHNYVSKEVHFGEEVYLTRKGAVSAKQGELGIIPGSMGAKSFIVRGKGNADSFCSCSHGAGRAMSRTAAKKAFSLEDHIDATKDVECRKDVDVIDETPLAYKDIDAVITAQTDLIEVVHTLRQVVCVKG